VCQGNLCRSPFAASVLRTRLAAAGLTIPVESAGLMAGRRVAPPDAVRAAAERGIDLSPHRSRSLDRGLVDAADLIVVMNPGHRRAVTLRDTVPKTVLVLGDVDPSPDAGREISDPLGHGLEAFRECYERIDRCVGQLVISLAGSTEAVVPPPP
jgi:protein-tyrosine-phosphatase